MIKLKSDNFFLINVNLFYVLYYLKSHMCHLKYNITSQLHYSYERGDYVYNG